MKIMMTPRTTSIDSMRLRLIGIASVMVVFGWQFSKESVLDKDWIGSIEECFRRRMPYRVSRGNFKVAAPSGRLATPPEALSLFCPVQDDAHRGRSRPAVLERTSVDTWTGAGSLTLA